MTATDTRLDFSLSACYSELTSRAGKDFIKRFEVVYPSKVKSIQTDNGSEFLDEFNDYLRRRNTPHYFSYRRCPRINGCIERYHRTLKEEFILNNLDVIDDMGLFGKGLVDYVIDLSEGNRTTTNSYMIDRED